VNQKKTFYAVLDILQSATQEQIREAYAAKAAVLEERGETMGLAPLKVAFETLNDPTRRAAYDASIQPKAEAPSLPTDPDTQAKPEEQAVIPAIPAKPFAPAKASKDEIVCTSCGFLGEPITVTKGSFGVELALWLCFLLPGLIYSVWRISTRHKACPACGNAMIIPSASPMGRKFIDEMPPHLLEQTRADEAARRKPPRPAWGSFAVVGGGMFLLYILFLFSGSAKVPPGEGGGTSTQPALDSPPAELSKIARENETARMMVSFIKSKMNDPDSFVLKSARVTDDETYCYGYRSKNGFGGYMSGGVISKPSEKFAAVSDDPGFDQQWAAHCENHPSRDVTEYAKP